MGTPTLVAGLQSYRVKMFGWFVNDGSHQCRLNGQTSGIQGTLKYNGSEYSVTCTIDAPTTAAMASLLPLLNYVSIYRPSTNLNNFDISAPHYVRALFGCGATQGVVAGSTTCTSCAVGTSSRGVVFEGTGSCVPCQSGKYTNIIGSNNCTDCAPGVYLHLLYSLPLCVYQANSNQWIIAHLNRLFHRGRYYRFDSM
jgi:hypothetical protein